MLNPTILKIRSFVIFMLGFLMILQSNGQVKNNINLVEISFVKIMSEQSRDSLYFNVLKLQNLTNDTLRLNLELQIPEVLSSMTAIPDRIVLKPNGKSNIAFRLSVSKNALSSTDYPIIALVKNSLGNILEQNTALVRIKVKRSWELLSPAAEINVIAGKEDMTNFSIPVRNNGNVTEKINLQLAPPEGYLIKKGKHAVDQFSVDLAAGKDTSLNFSLFRKGKENTRRTQDQLQITASNTLGEFRKIIRINSYSSRFEYVQEKINLDNFFEISHQVNLPNAQNRESFQTRGKIPLVKESREIQYSFMNYDLTNNDNFWGRSYYNLNYASKKTNFGIGQSYSSLGVDLYNTQGVFGDFKLDINKTNQLEFYTSIGINGDINCGAAGYQYKKGEFTLQTSSGYSTNDMYKQNIGSATFSSQVPFGEKQSLGINLRGVRRENLGDSTFFTQGFQGNFSYRLKLGSRFNFQARNLFNTPSFNRTNQSLFQLDMTSSFTFKKNRELYFSFDNNQRVYNVGQKLVQMGSENKVDDYNYVIYFKLAPSSKTSLKFGPWYKRLVFDEKLLSTQTDAYNIYIEAKKVGQPGYSASLIAGYREKIKTFPFADGMATVKKSYGNVHFTGALNGSFWGLNVQYDYGPPQMLSNIRDMDYWLLRISPRLQGDFFHEKLLCQVNLDYNADWGRKYKYVNLRTSIETVLKNNWRLSLNGYISTFGKLSISTLDKDLRLDIQFSLRKDFNWGKKKVKTRHYNVDTFFFRDDNKNGIFDANESGINNGFLKMASEKTETESRNISLSPVLSDKSGKVTYTNIPQGTYEMDISRMVNEDGYFNFNNSRQRVRVNHDTVCYIPFVKAYSISGNLKLSLASISSGKINSAKNIRVTATDSKGQPYSALTDMAGHYVLPVAGKEIYTVSINNPYGGNVEVKNNDCKVEFAEKEVAVVDFEFIETARKIRMKSTTGTTVIKESGKNEKVNYQAKTEVAKLANPLSDPAIVNNSRESVFTNKVQKKSSHDNVKSLSENNGSRADSTRIKKNVKPDYWIYNRISPDGKDRKNYWVVGVFRNMENTKQQLQLLKLRNIYASWIFIEENKLYYVYIKELIDSGNKK